MLALKTAGQVKTDKPVNMPTTGQFDLIRLVASKVCMGDAIINSKANFDLRIYRFMAFGDYKIIKISTFDKYNLRADVYSLNRSNNTIIYHKTFCSWGTDLKLKELVNKYDILNAADLDYKFVTTNSLPTVNDGNIYEIGSESRKEFYLSAV